LVDQGGARFLDTERGLPLGLSCGDYSQRTIALSPGSRLVFYSDGISEASNENEEEYGLDRLVKHVSSPERLQSPSWMMFVRSPTASASTMTPV